MNNPLISIIIPIYNIEKYISYCLDSVISQTYKNLEIICINDGSRDNSGDIVNQFAKKDKRIILIQKSNGGLSEARNTGIERASGDFIFFLDGDDCISEKCIETLVDIALKNNSQIAISQFATFTETKYFENTNYSSEVITMTGCQLYKLSYIEKNLKVTLNTAWGKLYAKELFNSIRYPKGKINEDEYITYKLFLISTTTSLTYQPLYGYRQRPGSIMSTIKNDPKRLSDLIDVFEKRIIDFQEEPTCNYIDLVIDDCLCQISSFYCLSSNADFKKSLIKKYRFSYLKYKNFLPLTTRIKRLLFYLTPFTYMKLAKAKPLASL